MFCNSAPVKSSVSSAISLRRTSFSSSERKNLFLACTYWHKKYTCYARISKSSEVRVSDARSNNKLTFSMASLPSFDGKPTLIILSKRPFLNRAGSRISSLFVAPMTNTWKGKISSQDTKSPFQLKKKMHTCEVETLNPSISVSIWSRPCSLSAPPFIRQLKRLKLLMWIVITKTTTRSWRQKGTS